MKNPCLREGLNGVLALACWGLALSALAADDDAQAPAQLPQVVVTGGILGELAAPHAGGQVARGGSLGLLGAQDIMDTPFSTTNYTAQVLHDQQTRTLADVLVNEASVRTLTSTGGFGEDFQIRGFQVNSGDVSVNGLYGLVSASRVPVQIVERVEVLKGPGALLRGMSPGGSVGGAINLVTKRAEDEPLARLTGSYVSRANWSGQLDWARRFGADKAWGARFNGVLRGGEATIRGGTQDLDMGALGVDWRGARLRWSADVIHQEDTLENIRSQIGFQANLTRLPAPPRGDVDFFRGTRLTQRDSTVMSRLEYDVSDTLTAHIGLGWREGNNRQIFPVSVAPGNLAQRLGADADGNFHVTTTYYDSYSKTRSADSGVTAYFDTAAVAHRLAFSVSLLAQEAGNAYAPGVHTAPSNIYHPAQLPPGPAQRLAPQRASDTQLRSYAMADTLAFAQERVLLTLGLRRQSVDIDSYNTASGAKTSRYKASRNTPLLALLLKPSEHVALYGNYTAGLSRGTIVGATYANQGEILAPFQSRQHEVGIKLDWGRITTTAALWQIKRPAGQANDDNVYGYFGTQRNRGLELAAWGEWQPGLRLMGSAAVTQARLTKTPGGINQGHRAYGVPGHTLSAGLERDVAALAGLSLNARAIRTAGSYFNNANTLRLAGYTRFDVGARYHAQVADRAVVLRANVENLANKRYWLVSANNYATNGAGRTVMLSASISY